ncbi:MAG TPA: hypothetical protein VG847_07005 [Chitinophagaceae bacterium]|nr:hypothetical protein [Chitinophagaceae bacterium]
MHSATILLLHPLDGGYEPQCFSSRRRDIGNSITTQVKIRVAISLLCITLACFGKAQQSGNTGIANNFSDSALATLQSLPSRYYSKADKKINAINQQLTKKTVKYLSKFEKQEARLQKKLQQVNPQLQIAGAATKYDELKQKIKTKGGIIGKVLGGAYSPYMDSLGTSFSFLKQFKNVSDKAEASWENVNDLQSKLQQSDEITRYIEERKDQIQQLLSSFTTLPAGIGNDFKKLQKTAYYYSAQVQQYKDILNDPDKIARQALQILDNLPAFQKFMRQNSQLASLFRIPDNSTGGSLANYTGLQTRSAVQSLIQQRIASGGPNALAQVQQNMQEAQAALGKLKDKINQLTGSGSGDVSMPDFKPNTQKTKPFLKRLEYGCNVQFSRNNSLLPTTANVAASIGYKLNDDGSLGIGASYNIGLGTLQHISITSQGVGLRSYLDWKIKKNFYASGGYEFNYNSSFKSIEQLKDYSAWQRSGLIGISKKYKLSQKLKGDIQLLYDFLARSHIPVSSPFLFRAGYNF